jgi:hypothetical protein
MILKQIAGKSLIYDGFNNNFYDEHFIKLNNGDIIKFNFNELIEFADAEKTLDIKSISTILNFCKDIQKEEPIPSIFVYKNEEELPVFFKSIDNYYLIIAQGEFQYGRYQIYVEGVFEKHIQP